MEQKFYICAHCGNIIAKVHDSGVPVMCCGQKMTEIIPGTTDASHEKHIPVWTVENGIVHVRVGSAAHPMTPEHHCVGVASDKVRQSAPRTAPRRRAGGMLCPL